MIASFAVMRRQSCPVTYTSSFTTRHIQTITILYVRLLRTSYILYTYLIPYTHIYHTYRSILSVSTFAGAFPDEQVDVWHVCGMARTAYGDFPARQQRKIVGKSHSTATILDGFKSKLECSQLVDGVQCFCWWTKKKTRRSARAQSFLCRINVIIACE